MHARIDHLLSLRDGQPLAAQVAAHVAECPSCTAQLERLMLRRTQLQALPGLDAPAASWSGIQRQLAQPREVSARQGATRFVAAAALAVLAVIVSVAVRDQRGPSLAERGDAQSEPPAGIDSTRVADLVAQSQHLDELLQELPQRALIQRVSSAATLDTIEQRIQWLDFQLSSAPDEALNETQARRLWRERVELMDSLVKVRYAEAGRATF